MWSKITVLLFMFLFHGCVLNSLFTKTNINKVTVVNHTLYMTHYAVFFPREDLNFIKNGMKYLYFYNKQKKRLSILLHPKNTYLLYSLTKPNAPVLSLDNNRYLTILKILHKKGYQLLKTPKEKGYLITVLPRIYKGIKTILVEVKVYTDTQKLYQRNIHTDKKTKPTPSTEKLNINDLPSTEKSQESQKTYEEKNLKIQQKSKDANISKSMDTEKNITKVRVTPEVTLLKPIPKLIKTNEKKEESEILKHGSIEELISLYKVNKKEIFKQRIMLLMQKKHQE